MLPTDNLYNEQELLLLISKGDEVAFRKLYDRHWNRVFSLAMHYLKMPGWAEDILQEVFTKIWLKRGNLSEIRSFEDFLFIITRNELMTALRQKARKEEVYQLYAKDFEGQALAGVQSFHGDIEKLVQQYLSQLTLQQQKIFKLSKHEGCTLDEIAAALGISKKTVSNSMSIILAELRLMLKNHGITLPCWALLGLILPVV